MSKAFDLALAFLNDAARQIEESEKALQSMTQEAEEAGLYDEDSPSIGKGE